MQCNQGGKGPAATDATMSTKGSAAGAGGAAGAAGMVGGQPAAPPIGSTYLAQLCVACATLTLTAPAASSPPPPSEAAAGAAAEAGEGGFKLPAGCVRRLQVRMIAACGGRYCSTFCLCLDPHTEPHTPTHKQLYTQTIIYTNAQTQDTRRHTHPPRCTCTLWTRAPAPVGPAGAPCVMAIRHR